LIDMKEKDKKDKSTKKGKEHRKKLTEHEVG